MWDAKTILSTVTVTALCFGVAPKLFPTVEAQAAPTQITDDLAPAKDLATFREDLTLTNQCIEMGRNKSECLCVTRVLKYELSMRDYRLASQLFAQKTSPSVTSAANMTVGDHSYNQADVTRISLMTQSLTQAKDFQNRCDMADSYFRSQAK